MEIDSIKAEKIKKDIPNIITKNSFIFRSCRLKREINESIP